MRTGPDDAGRVVWAIGNSFSFYFVFLILLTIVFIVYYTKQRVWNYRAQMVMVADGHRWPESFRHYFYFY